MISSTNNSYTSIWNRPLEKIASNKSSILVKIISGIAIGMLSLLSLGFYAVHAYNYLTKKNMTNLSKELSPSKESTILEKNTEEPKKIDQLRPACQIDNSSLKAPPTRKEFIAAVRAFKIKHQTKLKNFLVGKAWTGTQWNYGSDKDFIGKDQIRLREEFLSDPVIKGYLSRDSRFVPFYENRPALISDPNKRNESDYHECRIYALASQKKGTLFLPYRSAVMEDLFYKSGSYDQNIFRHIKTSAKGNCQVSKTGEDIYQIREQARIVELGQYNQKIKKKYNGTQFILSSNAKDTHSTTVISIFQKETFKHLASVFINSDNSENYFEYISSRFNSKHNRSFLLFRDDCEPICARFQEKMGDKTAYIDEENREGYLRNPSNSMSPTDPGEIAVYKAFDLGKIDIIHKLSHSELLGGKIYGIDGSRFVPLIDASHNLQKADEDKNCTLYSFNFIQGIANMLTDEHIADKIYRLAEQLNLGSKSEKTAARSTLTTIFKDELKRYLPAYYDAQGNQKSYDQIKEHHLYQRWDLGSLSMETEHLKNNGYLAEAK